MPKFDISGSFAAGNIKFWHIPGDMAENFTH
jgi:hypothetical protein